VLGKLGAKEVAPRLIDKLANETIEVQKSLVIALGELQEKEAAPQLIEFLNSDNVDLVRITAESLGRIGDARAVDPLIAVLNSPSVDVRRVVAQSLVLIGKRSGSGSDRRAQTSQSQRAFGRRESLGSIKDKRASLALIEALKDDNNRVRRYAALALGEIGDDNAAEGCRFCCKTAFKTCVTPP
jgi:HEAT repeat protein